MGIDQLSDDELRAELGRLLGESDGIIGLELHCCYLVRVKHQVTIGVGWNEPWQEQARYILSWMETRKAFVETKA